MSGWRAVWTGMPPASCSSSCISSGRRQVVGSHTGCKGRGVLQVVAGRRSEKIATRKGKSDAKKGKAFSTIGKRIVQYVKAGGPDPVANVALADLLKQAKNIGCPKDIIERNIKRATDKNQADFTPVIYEAYGPAGAALIIEGLTDNVNRAVSDVKSAITKSGCKVADSGSVMFSFKRAGQVTVEGAAGEDEVFEAAMEAGAEDIQAVPHSEDDVGPGQTFKVFTSVEAYVGALALLEGKGFKVSAEESSLIYKAATPIEVDDEAYDKCEALMDKLLDLTDVEAVFSNVEGLEAL